MFVHFALFPKTLVFHYLRFNVNVFLCNVFPKICHTFIEFKYFQ